MSGERVSFDQFLKILPEEGRIFLGDARALVLTAEAMGVLRKALMDTVGMAHARGILSRFGFACGYGDAVALRSKATFSDEREWLLAGPRMHALIGHVQVEPLEFILSADRREFRVRARWRNSYEAEQHKAFLGVAEAPVCWSLAGYASGWATAVLGEKALAVESRCAGTGEEFCELEIRRLADWGAAAKGAAVDLEGIDLHHEMSILERTVEALRASRVSERAAHRKFNALFDVAPDMIWIVELASGRFLDVNAAVVRTLGYSREELLAQSVLDLYFDTRDRERRESFVREVAEHGTGAMTATFRTRAGLPIELEMRASMVAEGRGQTLLVVARDLGDSVREHRRALALFEAFRRSNDVMFYCDRNGTILDVNAAFTRTYGFSREEAVGSTPRILRSKHSTQEMYQHMWRQILDPAKGFWRGQLINRTKEGRELPVILTITAVRDAKGDLLGYVSNAMDVSDQMALQGRVAHAEALATLGEMAAVVAHEIRNPLGSIVMAAKQLTVGKLAKADRDMVYRVLRDESQRLNETLTNFLAFARPRELTLERGDLNALVEDVGRTLQSNADLLRASRVELSTDAELQPFPFDRDQIRQVVWNIALNAVQAMDGRGLLRLSTAREAHWACLIVKDSGPGIPEAAQTAIFKPFHTTKQQGTGLGLAIAQRIVKAHGGAISLDSAPGRGAAFTVRLPCVQG
ncbi:MAG: PAS domain S-box protein [Elusimicrobia bacterium]|nr:PAS domain S-box protein [Elusimicrobiota bacterium]